jgi:PilZ domain
VPRGQLAIIPVPEGRKAQRRIVNLAAHLDEPGASVAEVDIVNLSTDGFMAHGEVALEPGATVWLKISGLEPQNSRVVWVEEGKAGFEFATPLHPATVELVVAASRKPVPKGHFGPRPS